jgi:mannose-6-phosphate isomerase-like protein (cupin superfamily)
MKSVKLSTALKRLRRLDDEIRHYEVFHDKNFTTGVIAFRSRPAGDPRQITHDAKDVVCQVIKGRGRLRSGRKQIALEPGMVCHIPKTTPHDFAAHRGELILFYALIRTA